MRRLLIVLTIFTLVCLASCTDNKNARTYGGSASVTLPKGEKLINVTWKETSLWYITRPMLSSDSAVTYTFKEKSSFGIMEGTYTIIETK
jgi:hypothetical protein